MATLLASLVLALAPAAAGAQPAVKVPRLGYVSLQRADQPGGTVRGLRQGLQELGHVEGRTIRVEYRFAEGRAERLPELIEELLRLPVDVLLTPGTVVTAAAKRATASVPIVMTTGDPVGSGLVESLARPGGNVTGLSLLEATTFELAINLRTARTLGLTIPPAVLVQATHVIE